MRSSLKKTQIRTKGKIKASQNWTKCDRNGWDCAQQKKYWEHFNDC